MKITVCGSFGYGNVGDEAVPLAIYDMAHIHKINLKMDVFGRFKEPDIKTVIGLGPKDSFRREAIRGQPLLMAGGGIIESLEHAVLFRCQEFINSDFTKHVSLFGISVEAGVKYSMLKKIKMRRITTLIDKIYVRDIYSEETLKKLLPNKQIEVIGDTVLWLLPEESTLFLESKKLPKQYIVVSLKHWKNSLKWYEWISRELSDIYCQYNLELIFVPLSTFYSDDDRKEHRSIKDYMDKYSSGIKTQCIEEKLSPKAVAYLYKNASLVVTMRLHGCVIAFAQKTPFVGIAYHPKLYGFADTVKCSNHIIPKKRPLFQDKNTYGYNFASLFLEKGMLTTTVNQVLYNSNFSQLDIFKKRIFKAFKEITKKSL